MGIVEITKENFEQEVIQSPIPVLVDFWASWCGPCQMLSPIVDEIAEERDDIKVGKIDVDVQGELAIKFGVMSIPTLKIFKDGEMVKNSVGLINKSQLNDMINSL